MVRKKFLNLQDVRPNTFKYKILSLRKRLISLHSQNTNLINTISIKLLYTYNFLRRKNKLATVIINPDNDYLIWGNVVDYTDIDKATVNYLQIAVAELIATQSNYKPFWNNEYNKLSQRLWLPTNRVNQVTITSKCNNYMFKTIESTKFNTSIDTSKYIANLKSNYEKPKNDLDEEVDQVKLKTRIIKLKTTDQQRKILYDWMCTSRQVYNQTVDAIRNGAKKNAYELRNKLVTKLGNPHIPEYMFRTPKEVRAEAVKDVIKAYDSALANLKAKNIKHFKLGHRTKKERKNTIVIPSSAIKNKNGIIKIYPTYFLKKTCFKMDKRTLKANKDLVIKNDCRLKLYRNEFYLHVPVDISYADKTNSIYLIKSSTCGIDPGVRSFLTIYDEHGVTESVTHKEKFKRLKKKIDLMKHYRISKRQINKVKNKFSNLVDDMHWKTATMITDSYENIFMGRLDSQKCLIKSRNRTMNRDMNLLKPYEFRCKLRWLAIRKNRKMWIVPEHYTSKTCGNCGNLTDCGSSKEYNCSRCAYVADRDVNAARNILLKGLLTNQKR